MLVNIYRYPGTLLLLCSTITGAMMNGVKPTDRLAHNPSPTMELQPLTVGDNGGRTCQVDKGGWLSRARCHSYGPRVRDNAGRASGTENKKNSGFTSCYARASWCAGVSRLMMSFLISDIPLSLAPRRCCGLVDAWVFIARAVIWGWRRSRRSTLIKEILPVINTNPCRPVQD